MRKLILVKHSQPQVDAKTPAERWLLSDLGRERCAALAEKLAVHEPSVLLSSHEPKAVQTAEILSQRLGRPMEVLPGLHEHDRSNVPLMDTREFLGTMALMFKRPRELVIGRETAEAALVRFDSAVRGAIESRPEGNLAIVAHGTVIALFVAHHAQAEPYAIWRQMGLPSFVVMSVPEYKRLDQVDRV